MPRLSNMEQIYILAALVSIGALSFLAARYDTFPGDMDVLTKLQGLRSGRLDTAAVWVTSLTTLRVAIVSVFALSFLLWYFHRRGDAMICLMLFIPQGFGYGLKMLVDRPRPDFALLTSPPGSPAFPSGHAVHALVLFGLLIYLAGELITPRWARLTVQGGLVLAILGVGASRVYLGVHWPSDVLGGYLLGGFCILAIIWIRQTRFYRDLQ